MKLKTFFQVIFLLAIFLPGWINEAFGQKSFLTASGMAVFYPVGFDSVLTLPSFSIEKELLPWKDIPSGWALRPQFSIENGKAIAKVTWPGHADLYGTGEVKGALKRNGTEVILWNTDNYGYGKAGGKRLYQSHPWVMGVRPDGSSFGIIADHSWKQTISLTDTITFTSDGPPFRMIIIEKDSPQELLKTLADLTGTIDMPPLWALGYQQCRYSYYPEARVREIATEFRKRKIPCDVIWMDIDYMQNYKVFTFDSVHFPDPAQLNDYLHQNGFKSVWMIDPGIKKEKGYFVYDQGSAGNHWVLNSNREEFNGRVWPGACSFPDFTIPETRRWWESLYKDFMQTGVDGVWNDMNEPSVFNGPGGSMPEDNIHRGGGALPEGSHLRYHNVYGLLMVQSSREGILKALPGKRPFVLSRSNFLGGQKFAATWTGDNVSSWDHLKMSTPMVLNLGLSGQPFSGPDIGGFSKSPDPELLAHWMAIGAFYPFSRNHAEKNTAAQEPWAMGQMVEDVSRTALQRRYRLLPYLYTLFHEASTTGMPVMRPVWFADIRDTTLRSEQEAFLLGADLMVIPKWSEKPRLPQGIWKSITLVGEDSRHDPYQPDLKLRGGAILPMSRVIQSTADYHTDSLTLLVCPDADRKAAGTLYVDAGEGFGYRNGDYEVNSFTARKSGKNALVVRCKTTGVRQTADKRCYQVGVVTDTGVVWSAWHKSNRIKVTGMN